MSKSAFMNKLLHERYQIIAKIGEGASSEVFLVNDLKLNCCWALKKIEKGNSDFTKLAYENMRREVELLAGLHHQGIPRIIDRFQEENVSYAVMDFVDGISLKKQVQSCLPSESEVICWMLQVAEVMIYLHTSQKQPIIFRDLKPENILLDRLGTIQLIDFGSAVLHDGTQKFQGVCLGTRGFASPEQCQHGFLDERSDIYSFGATMYYLMTASIYRGTLHDLSSSQGFHMIISRCLMDHPKDRYSTMQELYDDLVHIDKLNLDYRKQLCRASLPFFASMLLTFFFLSGTAFFWYLHKKESSVMYEAAMLQEDYETAVVYHQNQIEPFLLYYETCKQHDKGQDGVRYAISRMEDLKVLSLKLKDKDELLNKMILDCIQIKHTLYYQKARQYIKQLTDQKREIINCYEVLLAFLVNDLQINENDPAIEKQIDLLLKNMNGMSSMQQIWNYELIQTVFISDLQRFSWERIEEISKREWIFVRALPQELAFDKEELKEQIKDRWVYALYYQSLQEIQNEKKDEAISLLKHLIYLMTENFQVQPDQFLYVRLAEIYEYLYDLNHDEQMLKTALQKIEEACSIQNSQECSQAYLRMKRKMERG